jgi:hypothetical protein
MYREGQGLPRDDEQAALWYRRAAEQGHAAAQNNLARLYDDGEGVPLDDAEAARWYAMAANQGMPVAQNNLGLMYANGEGVERDPFLAYVWLGIAAKGLEGDLLASATAYRDEAAQELDADRLAEAQAIVEAWRPEN